MSDPQLDGYPPRIGSEPDEETYEGVDHEGRPVKRRAFAGVRRSTKAELIRQRNGKPKTRHGLPEKHRERIRQRLLEGVPAETLAEQYGVSEDSIRYLGR